MIYVNLADRLQPYGLPNAGCPCIKYSLGLILPILLAARQAHITGIVLRPDDDDITVRL
ncbi:hypothetical protein D3C74_258150 [compost metagenome]